MFGMRFDRKDFLLELLRYLDREGYSLDRIDTALSDCGPVDLDLLNECCIEVLAATGIATGQSGLAKAAA